MEPVHRYHDAIRRAARGASRSRRSRPALIEQGLEHAPGDTHHALIFADSDAELDNGAFRVPSGIERETEEHGRLGEFW